MTRTSQNLLKRGILPPQVRFFGLVNEKFGVHKICFQLFLKLKFMIAIFILFKGVLSEGKV